MSELQDIARREREARKLASARSIYDGKPRENHYCPHCNCTRVMVFFRHARVEGGGRWYCIAGGTTPDGRLRDTDLGCGHGYTRQQVEGQR